MSFSRNTAPKNYLDLVRNRQSLGRQKVNNNFTTAEYIYKGDSTLAAGFTVYIDRSTIRYIIEQNYCPICTFSLNNTQIII